MNKIVGFGVAIALCMAAAGFGAYMALRPQQAAVPADVLGKPAFRRRRRPRGLAA